MDIPTLIQIKNNFLGELQQSTSGQQTSLPFIRHHLKTTSLVKSGGIIQVIVVGGSNFQKALIQNIDGQFRIISHDIGPQPKFATKMDFLAFLASHVKRDVEVVALNFAYPLAPVLRSGILDGILQSGSKENVFDGLVGKQVGDEIEKYMKHVHGRSIRVAIGNDVVCLLLSGLTKYRWGAIGAGIVGTGLNFAIFLDEHTIVNLESADFSQFTQSEEVNEIDKLSASPGMSLYEKEVSGAYLHKHYNILAKNRGLPVQNIDSSEQLSLLIQHEMRSVAELARVVLNHSASLVAAQIAGILEFSKRDIIFIMQGSLYWKGNGYRESVEHFVTRLAPGYRATYEYVPHSDLIGAAKLVI